MKPKVFSPGFRISRMDMVILFLGILVAAFLAVKVVSWAGFVVGFVVVHFFLFCNVFRISRKPELIWAAAFLILAGSTILFGVPNWAVTTIVSLVLSAVLIALEMKKKSYHGVGWERVNPSLPSWWYTVHAAKLREEEMRAAKKSG